MSEILLCQDDTAFYVGSVCFERHGHINKRRECLQWVAHPVFDSLAEDLRLIGVRTYPAREFVVDDFGNLRIARLQGDESQWRYSEEWDEYDRTGEEA